MERRPWEWATPQPFWYKPLTRLSHNPPLTYHCNVIFGGRNRCTPANLAITERRGTNRQAVFLRGQRRTIFLFEDKLIFRRGKYQRPETEQHCVLLDCKLFSEGRAHNTQQTYHTKRASHGASSRSVCSQQPTRNMLSTPSHLFEQAPLACQATAHR